jgi:crotonobetainyl-CoA:carnitine CoA-transferase CaiB-like acyl-CoA transferase
MKVLDLSNDVAGRFAARLFVLGGADVVRPQVARDWTRDTTPELDDYLDAGKRNRTELEALLAGADLAFTSFDLGRPIGLTDAQRAMLGSAVEVTTSTFGTTGAWSGWRGGPLAEWAAGGYLAITGEADLEPLIGPERLCGYVAGYAAAIAAEAGLRQRRNRGHGVWIDVSTMEAMLAVHQSTFSRVAAGLGRKRTGRYTEVYPLVVRPCRDGHVSLGVVTDAEFDRLAIVIGQPELAADPRFADATGRWLNRDELDRALARFLLDLSCEEVVERMRAGGLAAAKVADVFEVLENPQLRHRGFWQDGDPGAMPGSPIGSPTVFQSVSRRQPGPIAAPIIRRPTKAGLPLEGVMVLDITAFWAGPSATRNLSDLGATVIKIERPGSRIDLESQLENPQSLVDHLYHCKMNRGKLSVAVDLEAPDGRAKVLRLAQRADVLVENFRPGVADRLGIGVPALSRLNPRLVYVSLTGFGSTGPWGGLRSYGPTIEAASSIEWRTGYHGGEPLRLGHTLPDGVGGLAGTLAVLRALRERDGDGRGRWFDISQLEAYVALSGEEILSASRSGQIEPRVGNRSRSGALQGVFPCLGEDEWIAIRLLDQLDVATFAAAAGLPGLPAAAAPARRAERRIEEMIAAFTRTREKHALAAELQLLGIEAVPVLTAEELPRLRHLLDRGFLVPVSAGGRTFMLPGSPLRGVPPMVDAKGALPRFGEHGCLLEDWLAGKRPDAARERRSGPRGTDFRRS